MTKKSCYTRATSIRDHQHGLSEFTEQQGGSSAGPKKKSWKRYYLTFVSKFKSKTNRKKPANIKAPAGTRQKNSSRSVLRSLPVLEERGNLAQAIRRAAAGCFAAKMAAGAEDDLPYVQLDKVTYGEKREDFGPVYMVT